MKLKQIFSAACLLVAAGSLSAQPVEIGAPAPVLENRGILAVNDASGAPLVAAFGLDNLNGRNRRSSLVLVDVLAGEATQYWYPEQNNANGQIFHLLRTSDHRVYVTFSGSGTGDLVAFDLNTRSWIPLGEVDGIGMSFIEAPDGKVYMASYPNANLWEIDPKTNRIQLLTQLDPEEKYVQSLAVGKDGWLYAGVGTARNDIVAYNLKTKELRPLVPEQERTISRGIVAVGKDGEIYGRARTSGTPWLLLRDGAVERVLEGEPELATPDNVVFFSSLNNFPQGGNLLVADLPNREVEVELADGTRKHITFDYETEGASASSFTVGNDGSIYGSTAHPLRFWKYDPKTEKLSDFGYLLYNSGGNFPNLFAWREFIVGAIYTGGRVYSYDTTQPWETVKQGSSNPVQIGRFNAISRPRVAILARDGKTGVLAGYGGYGHSSGAIVFLDLESRKSELVPMEKHAKGHSPLAMRELEDGLWIVGTSTIAPGGGHRLATESLLFLYDKAEKKITYQMTIGPDVYSLEMDTDGNVHGLASGGRYFIFDPVKRKLLVDKKLPAELGGRVNPGQAFVRDSDGTLYALMSESICRVTNKGEWTKLTSLPVPAHAGIAIIEGELYYAAGAKLWKYKLPDLKK